MGLFFHAVLFCYCYLAYLFSMQVDWFLIKIKSIVGQASLARFLFQLSKFGHHISVKQLWCESQLCQIVVFGIGTRKGFKLFIFKVVPEVCSSKRADRGLV